MELSKVDIVGLLRRLAVNQPTENDDASFTSSDRSAWPAWASRIFVSIGEGVLDGVLEPGACLMSDGLETLELLLLSILLLLAQNLEQPHTARLDVLRNGMLERVAVNLKAL
jgi:hypothetical protein